MEYLTGYTIKPYEITLTGEVLFTDGTNNDLMTNQATCEAYGYTYDIPSGTCVAFRANSVLDRAINNINNKNNGAGNTTELGSNTNQVNGTLNTLKGFNNNCFINGSANKIANGVNNTTVFGHQGEATVTNSIVLGANTLKPVLNIIQNITVMCKVETDDNTATDSPLNGEAGVHFEIPEDTILAFQSETVAVRTGGAGAGSVGDFKAFIETGVAANRGGTLIVDKGRTTIANTGTTTGWVCNLVASGTTLVQQVTGANNRDIQWATTIRITQNIAGVSLR